MQSSFTALKKPSPPRRHQRGQKSKTVASPRQKPQSLLGPNSITNEDAATSVKAPSDALVQPPFYLTPVIVLPASYPTHFDWSNKPEGKPFIVYLPK